MKRSSLCVGLLFLFGSAYAEAPVVDATPSGIYKDQPTMPIASPTVSSRVQALEQELQKLNQKVTSLQQTNQDLTNLVSMQNKQITALQKQKSYPIVKQPVRQSMAVAVPKKNNFAPAPIQQKPVTKKTAAKKSAIPEQKMVVVEQTTTKKTSTPKTTTPKTTTKPTGDLYEQAYSFVKAQQYSKAIPLLQQYVKDYPTGKNAGDAYYWLGQLQMIAGNSKQAQAAYTNLVNHYPHAEHVPDAMLQLAAIAGNEQQWATAKQWLQKVLIAYPNSAGARLAKVRLQQLQQAGH